MQQFLFVVEVPATQGISSARHYTHEWTAFVSSANKTLKSVSGHVEIHMNAWLLPAKGAWPALESLVESAKAQGLSYSITLFSGETTVLTASVKP